MEFSVTFGFDWGRLPCSDMERLLRVMATIAVVSTVLPVLRTRVVLHGTTLGAAAIWAAAALGAWELTWLATDGLGLVDGGWADQLWFAVAVLAVSPFIAVLGARRPGSRVWSWFIVFPLTLVLFLPALSAWGRELRPAPLHLEVPMLAGYALVLFMGTINYLGTRFALPALLTALACLAVVLPASSFSARLPIAISRMHPVATILLSFAVWQAMIQVRRNTRSPNKRPSPLDQAWNEFRDLFGIVWARRIMDRMNAVAVQEQWPVRLHLDGFEPVSDGNGTNASPDWGRIEQSFRWLLRRFVDSHWIDRRMGR